MRLCDFHSAGIANGLPVKWSTHAVERFTERFPDDFDAIIPYALMQRVGANKAINETFKIGYGKVEYILVRHETAILVVTVVPRECHAVRFYKKHAGAPKKVKGRKRQARYRETFE